MILSLDKDLLLDRLRRELLEKELEINKAYETIERVNLFIENLIQDTELGIKATMNLHRRLFSKKLPNFTDITFSSKYIVSSSESSSYYDFINIKEGESFGVIVSDTHGYGLSALIMGAITSLIDRVFNVDSKGILSFLMKDIEELVLSKQTDKDLKDDIALFMLNFSRSDLSIEFSGKDMPGVFILRNNAIHYLKPEYNDDFISTEFKLYPADKIIIFNNGLINSINKEGKKFSIEVLEALLSNLKSLPIGDIVHNIGYEVNKHSSNKRSLLGGDIVILGMELEKKILYVV